MNCAARPGEPARSKRRRRRGVQSGATCLPLLLSQASAQGFLGAGLIAALALQQRLREDGGGGGAAARCWTADLAGHGCAVADETNASWRLLEGHERPLRGAQ